MEPTMIPGMDVGSAGIQTTSPVDAGVSDPISAVPAEFDVGITGGSDEVSLSGVGVGGVEGGADTLLTSPVGADLLKKDNEKLSFVSADAPTEEKKAAHDHKTEEKNAPAKGQKDNLLPPPKTEDKKLEGKELEDKKLEDKKLEDKKLEDKKAEEKKQENIKGLEKKLDDAKKSLSDLKPNASKDEKDRAQKAVDDAKRALDDAKGSKGATPPNPLKDLEKRLIGIMDRLNGLNKPDGAKRPNNPEKSNDSPFDGKSDGPKDDKSSPFGKDDTSDDEDCPGGNCNRGSGGGGRPGGGGGRSGGPSPGGGGGGAGRSPGGNNEPDKDELGDLGRNNGSKRPDGDRVNNNENSGSPRNIAQQINNLENTQNRTPAQNRQLSGLYGQAIQNLERMLNDPSLTPEEREELQRKINELKAKKEDVEKNTDDKAAEKPGDGGDAKP